MFDVRDIPAGHQYVTLIPNHAAATATEEYPIFVAHGDCEVMGVTIVPQAAVTGQDTNTTHLNIIDKGTDGTGTTERANYDLTNGNDLAAFDEFAFTLTNPPIAADDGTVWTLQYEKVSSGLAVPHLLVRVEYRAKGKQGSQ